MTTLKQAAEECFSQRRIGRGCPVRHRAIGEPDLPSPSGHRPYGFAVNPNAEEVEGDRRYGSVGAIPDGVDGVVVVTPATASADVAADCADAGVPRVWLQRGIGPGSTSEEAVTFCRDHGIAVMPGGCPCMFGETADPGHKCMRAMLRVSGKLPQAV